MLGEKPFDLSTHVGITASLPHESEPSCGVCIESSFKDPFDGLPSFSANCRVSSEAIEPRLTTRVEMR
jgi:hypothetical protein